MDGTMANQIVVQPLVSNHRGKERGGKIHSDKGDHVLRPVVEVRQRDRQYHGDNSRQADTDGSARTPKHEPGRQECDDTKCCTGQEIISPVLPNPLRNL